jgi:phosphoribosylformylglycinamidine synthase subunit PurL
VACSGARPIAATNCLNFGNPEKPEVMWQFSESIDGIGEACGALETPITGGNVSFYNETLGKPIYPTPILGVLGLLEDAECALGSGFRNEGDLILLLDGSQGAGKASAVQAEFLSSEYAKTIHGIVAGMPPDINLPAEKKLIDCLVKLAGERAVFSAHDVSDGGLAVTLGECCFTSGGLAAEIVLGPLPTQALTNERPSGPESSPEREGACELALFEERGARAVVSCSPELLARVSQIAAQYGVHVEQIGSVTRTQFRIQYDGSPVIQGSVDSFRQSWNGSLAAALQRA